MKRALAALPLLLACACSGSGGSGGGDGSPSVAASGPPSAQTVTVAMTNKLTFDPDEVTAAVGTLTLTASNTGSVPHDLTFKDDALGHTPQVDGGRTAQLKLVFTKPGSYAFVCTLHARMSGRVVVS